MTLTYCTNIYPGEAWADVVANLEGHLLAVKAAVAPDTSFPIGLRVSAQAASELSRSEGEAKRFRDWCDIHGCHVATINGFPHGRFHGERVKQKVYRPDWREPERVAYTRRLADLLAVWLPEGSRTSISTVPVAFRKGFDAGDWPAVRRHVALVLEHLARIRDDRGVEIVLSFEPEPGCVLETTQEVPRFFERLDLPASLQGLAGICFDCCHQAVEFESPVEALGLLRDAQVRIGKVQVSSSLRAVGEAEIAALAGFDEPTYLHQVVARDREGRLRRWNDLPDFVADAPAVEEARVHFHVPIFVEHLGPCGTTRAFLEEILPLLDPQLPLEVETYSFHALPESLRLPNVADSIVRELQWVREQRA